MLKKIKNIKGTPKRVAMYISVVLLLFSCFALITHVWALASHGEGEYCMRFHIDDFGGFLVSNVTVNGEVWDTLDDHEYHTNNNRYEIVVYTGRHGEDDPWISTAGGLDDYKTYYAVENPNEDPNVDNDEYMLTLIMDGAPYNGACYYFGISLVPGPFPVLPVIDAEADISITISGDELEYHYDAEHLDEADVAYFKFDINGGTDDAHLVPFTFRNAEYTYNDGEPPKNVSSVTTKQPIHYRYTHNGTGTVNFCVNGGGTDEYTHIIINGVDYGNQAPHSKVEHFEAMMGWAQMFCIEIPYNETEYIVEVTGEQTAAENRIPGLGWNYLSADRSEDITPQTEGNFAHGRLEFVSATYTVDGNETITIDNVNDFNNYRYHGTGQIFQWNDGNKEYPEEERWRSWGEAQFPYGTTLTVRIVPDEGYQLISFASGPNGFQPTETPGEYRITLDDSNFPYNGVNNAFDLNPTFTQIGAEVRTGSVNVRNGNIETNQTVENGSLKLEVNDTVSMSPERLDSFENKAEQEGYEIENYLDISLYNAIYKGGQKDANNNYLSWDTEINNLSEAARITLELEQNMEGKELALIHEKRNGDNYTYEVIPVNYNSENNTIAFETNSFSDYAVAVRNAAPGENPGEDPQPEKVTVEYNTQGGSEIATVEIDKGSTAPRPEDPTNGDKVFGGWYEEGDCEHPYNFDSQVNGNIIIYAKWLEPENVEDYEIPDESGNIILFTEEKDHEFHLFITDYLSYTKEQVMQVAGINSEQYDAIFNGLKNSTKKYGDLLSLYEIEVKDEDDRTLEEGPFTIKIKLTDKMKKYNTFKLFYVNEDFSVDTTSSIELKKEGNYLVGTLEHLSVYTLVGNNTLSIPGTGDNIVAYISLAVISMIGLSISILLLKKKKVFN